MALTDDARERYLAAGGTFCPYCGCQDIEGDSIDIEGGRATQLVGCSACGREWYDVYALQGVIEIEPSGTAQG